MTCNWGDWGAENFVDFNWMGWAWAAACSWANAQEQSEEEFEYAFCSSFHGMQSPRLAKAQELLANANRVFPWGQHPLGYFHSDPFAADAIQSWPSAKQIAQLESVVEEAASHLTTMAPRVRHNQETLQYLHHAIRRYRYVVSRARKVAQACEAYASAREAANEKDKREAELQRCLGLLTDLRGELQACRDEFRQLWLAANRPQGLDFDLQKFDAQLSAYDKRIAALKEAARTGELPSAESLGLISRKRRAGVPVVRGHVAASPTWHGEGWLCRMPLQLDAGEVDRPAMPVTLQLNLSSVGGETIEPGSLRLVVEGEEYPAQVVPLWTSDGLEPDGGVVFLLPQPLAKGETLKAELYWNPKAAIVPSVETDLEVGVPLHLLKDVASVLGLAEAEKGLATDAAQKNAVVDAQTSDTIIKAAARAGARVKIIENAGQIRIENTRMVAMLGSEGAHLYQWFVKALGGRDITQPGTRDWAGFLDLNSVRQTPFVLRPVAVGPVAVMIEAAEEHGLVKYVTVYAGLPVVEMRLSAPTPWMWNYDDVRNFAADGEAPGTARLADGTEAPVPKMGEQIHIRPRTRVRWGVKYRADGLTLGLITPGADTDMRIGPGGGWGGVGIEQSAPADWFLTYCDVTEGTWRTVAALADAMRPETPIRVTVGRVERRAGAK
jgi:hypothetical protein